MHSRKYSGRRALLVGSVVALGLSSACSAAETDTDTEPPLAEESQAVQVRPATPNSQWRWTSGDKAVDMTSYSNSVCFLMGVDGSYESTGDRIEIVKNTNTGKWLLRGTTGTGVPAGRAACAEGVAISKPPSPDANGMASFNSGVSVLPTDLGPATNRTCLLTAIWGNYGGDDDQVRTQIGSNGRWQLAGQSAAGAATCVARAPEYPVDLSMQPQALGEGYGIGAMNDAATNTPYFCGLTRVKGWLRYFGFLALQQYSDGGTRVGWLLRVEYPRRPGYPGFPDGPRLPLVGSSKCFQ